MFIETFVILKVIKAQDGRIPIDPAIMAAIGHRFIAIKRIPETGDFFLPHGVPLNKTEAFQAQFKLVVCWLQT